MELKLNDVYRFRYNDPSKNYNSYHCFDGQLIVKQKASSNLYLEDTYWCSGGNRTFTLEQALREGKLNFVCNLNEVEKINESELKYYADEDIFDLSYQHSCYKKYVKRKDAVRCPEKMERVLIRKIEELEHNIEWENARLIEAKEKLEKLRNGDINIYI